MFLIFYLAIALGILSSIVHLIAYFSYYRKINVGRVKPNATSWSVWALGSVLESASYVGVTGDWVKNLLPICCAISAVILFFYCLHKGHFSKLRKFEGYLLVFDCVALLVWWWYQSAFYANILFVAIAIISFIPIIWGVWVNPMVEDSLPWYLWTCAYFLLVLVILFRWNKWEDLVYPLMFLLLHLTVAILAIDRRLPKSLKFKS